MIKKNKRIKKASNVCSIAELKIIQDIAKEYKKICTATNIKSKIKYKTVQENKRFRISAPM